jgi:hypothetical protein
MKRLIIALVAGCALFGIVFAVAAALNLNNSVLQAGGDTNQVCDADGFQTYWNVNYQSGDFYVTGVTVAGISGSCVITDTGGAKTLDVVVSGAGGVNLAEQTTAVTNDSNKVFTFGTPILASSVEDIHVAIY